MGSFFPFLVQTSLPTWKLANIQLLSYGGSRHPPFHLRLRLLFLFFFFAGRFLFNGLRNTAFSPLSQLSFFPLGPLFEIRVYFFSARTLPLSLLPVHVPSISFRHKVLTLTILGALPTTKFFFVSAGLFFLLPLC